MCIKEKPFANVNLFMLISKYSAAGINMHRIPDNQIGMQICNNIDYITYIL